MQRQPTPEEETIVSVTARRFTKEYLEKTAQELPQLFIEETASKKKRAARKRAAD